MDVNARLLFSLAFSFEMVRKQKTENISAVKASVGRGGVCV